MSESCTGADGICLTCSDAAFPARIVRVDQEQGLAFVLMQDDGDAHVRDEEEIDITLVEAVAPGDLVLVHGGVAVALLEGETTPPSLV